MINIAGPEELEDINIIRAAITADPSNDHSLSNVFDSDILQTRNQVTFSYKQEQRCVGYLSLHPHPNNECIFEMFVMPGMQGRGIGSKLIKHCVEYVKSDMAYPCINLTVLNSNSGAIRLYERNGFKTYRQEPKGRYMRLDLVR